ncbi:MAG: hypothetical protein JWR61_1316 [Ferruginibacter sp.]|uniref:DUF5655 domain-containing protein n=1 Tax=Ferruginibacter sp. TaxID=1940288 RepID=UPI00265A3DC9|nr:DUF5655 domain-containing protein [Ferruginibacter sp.]MDB5276361.1 hypothetical protein [Ferruginibacter sp.]
MKVFSNNKIYNEFPFDREADFEKEVVNNSKLFFGPKSIYIDAKKKIETKSLGNSIPDGFLFDMSDITSPEFYIVEVELVRHDFYNHIFPQITKFFSFYRNHKSQIDLAEKIYTVINNDPSLKAAFKTFLGEQEIYKFLKDTIQHSQNILLIIDGDKKELPEIMDTYGDTWGKMVKLLLVKKFANGGDIIYTMHPEFENIEYAEIVDAPLKDTVDSVDYTEQMHLDGVSDEIRDIYQQIKKAVFEKFPSLIINPTKHYISVKKDRNIFFMKFSTKKMIVVLPQSETDTAKDILFHPIKILPPNVQRFWFGNGAGSSIIIDNAAHLDEVLKVLFKSIEKFS